MVYLKIAISQLQIIARILDEEEDEKLRNKEILDLVDAFEEKDEKVMMERLQQNFAPLHSAPPPYDFNENNGTDPRNRDQFSHEEKITIDRFSETNGHKDLNNDSTHIWNIENKEGSHLGNRKTFEECVRTLRYNDQEEKEEEKSPYYQFIPEFVPLRENVRENGTDEEEECTVLSVQNRYCFNPSSALFAILHPIYAAVKVLVF